MRNVLALVLMGLLALVIAGCAQTNTETSKEHTHRIKKNMEKDCKNLADDWDRFWMAEEPSGGTMNHM